MNYLTVALVLFSDPLITKFISNLKQSARKLSIRIESDKMDASGRKDNIQINPWTLIKMSKEKAMAAAEHARERIRQKLPTSPMKPLPVETKRGPLNPERKHITTGKEIVPAFTKSWLSGSPTAVRISSPRRRFSGSSSPKPQRYRSDFDRGWPRYQGSWRPTSRSRCCAPLS